MSPWSTIAILSAALLTQVSHCSTLPANTASDLKVQGDSFPECTQLIDAFPNDPPGTILPAHFHKNKDGHNSDDDDDDDVYALSKQQTAPHCQAVVTILPEVSDYSSWYEIKAQLADMNNFLYRTYKQGRVATRRTYIGQAKRIILYLQYFPEARASIPSDVVDIETDVRNTTAL